MDVSNLSFPMLIALIIFTSGSLAERSVMRKAKTMVYAACAFCVATFCLIIEMSVIESMPLVSSVPRAFGIGVTSVAFFFIARYLAVRELSQVVGGHGKGGAS